MKLFLTPLSHFSRKVSRELRAAARGIPTPSRSGTHLQNEVRRGEFSSRSRSKLFNQLLAPDVEFASNTRSSNQNESSSGSHWKREDVFHRSLRQSTSIRVGLLVFLQLLWAVTREEHNAFAALDARRPVYRSEQHMVRKDLDELLATIGVFRSFPSGDGLPRRPPVAADWSGMLSTVESRASARPAPPPKEKAHALMMSARNDRNEVRSRRLVRGILAVVILSLAMAPGAAAGSENVSASGQVSPLLDAMLLRPLGLVAVVGGAALFLVSVPIVLMTRPSEMSIPFEMLVMKPVRYTWIDPLGDHAAPVD